MKHTILLFTGIACIIMILLVVQISVSNMLSTGGIELSRLQDQIHGYQKENAILKEKILSISSFTTLAQKAEQEGFLQNKTVIEVISNTQPPLAYRQ